MCGPVTTRRGCAVNLTRRALQSRPAPVLVTTDWTPVYPRVIDELVPAASHVCEQYANNSMGSDTTERQGIGSGVNSDQLRRRSVGSNAFPDGYAGRQVLPPRSWNARAANR
jgi:hypothetical protein